MNILTQLPPDVWGPVCWRVAKLLRAHRIETAQLARLLQQIVRAAAAQHARSPERAPLDLAIDEAHRLLGAPRVPVPLRSEALAPVPPVARAAMVPEPVDFGPAKAMAETARHLFQWPLVRGAVVWAVALSALGTAFYLTSY